MKSSKKILVVVTIAWLGLSVAWSVRVFQKYAGQHDQLESALGAFLVMLTPGVMIGVLLLLFRALKGLGRMRFPH